MQDTPAASPIAAQIAPPRAPPMPLSPGWLLFAALALAVPLGAMLFRGAQKPEVARLAVLSALPDFSLVDQSGRPFARKDLLGRAWAADLIFTHCSDACPRLTATMKRVQTELLQDAASTASGSANGPGLLSISVDPKRDTPEALHTYAEANGADPRVWRFLTGDQRNIERAVVEGFKMGIDTAGDPSSQALDIMHGEKFVLIDSLGRIRGYYEVSEEPELQRLIRDLRELSRGGDA